VTVVEHRASERWREPEARYEATGTRTGCSLDRYGSGGARSGKVWGCPEGGNGMLLCVRGCVKGRSLGRGRGVGDGDGAVRGEVPGLYQAVHYFEFYHIM